MPLLLKLAKNFQGSQNLELSTSAAFTATTTPLDPKVVKSMLKKYRKERIEVIKERTGVEDSRCSLVPRQVFEELMQKEWDALRIYYGLHIDGDNVNRHNLIFVTATKVGQRDNLGDADIVYFDQASTATDGYGVCPPPYPASKCPGATLVSEADAEFESGNQS